MKKILIIAESIHLNDSSGAKANIALIKNIAQLGYQIKVIHYSRINVKIKGIETITIKEIKFSFTYFLSRIQRVFSRFFKIDLSNVLENTFGHSFTFFNDSNSITTSINKHYTNQDLIITLSKGASFRPHYAMLSIPELHNKWLAYVHDPFPFHFYPRPYNWVDKGYKFKEKFFKEVSEKANYAAFPSLLLKDWMGSYFPNFLKTGIIIPHQAIKIETKATKLPSFFDSEKFSLLHAGNLIKQRNPKGLIEGYLLFLDNNKEANTNSQLLLIGSYNHHKSYLEKIKNKTINICSYLDFNITYKIQQSVSVNIILESKSEISPFLPGKFPHCISANKPILLLAPYFSETNRLLGKEYLYTAEVDHVNLIAKHIEVLYRKWTFNKNVLLGRKDLEEYVGMPFLEKQFRKILK